MKKIILMAILVLCITLLLSGCAVQQYKEAKQMETEAEEHLEKVQEQVKQVEAVYTVPETSPEPTTVEAPEEDEGDDMRYITTDDGSTVGLKNLGDYRDTKVGEMCDFDYPFACSEYITREGTLFLTLKYNGYPSKIEDVELTLGGEYCDPTGGYIEPGQVKEFTCYLPMDISSYSGDFEIKYFHNIDRTTRLKTGKIVVNNI